MAASAMPNDIGGSYESQVSDVFKETNSLAQLGQAVCRPVRRLHRGGERSRDAKLRWWTDARAYPRHRKTAGLNFW
jgi:hypothetical protein